MLHGHILVISEAAHDERDMFTQIIIRFAIGEGVISASHPLLAASPCDDTTVVVDAGIVVLSILVAVCGTRRAACGLRWLLQWSRRLLGCRDCLPWC